MDDLSGITYNVYPTKTLYNQSSVRGLYNVGIRTIYEPSILTRYYLPFCSGCTFSF